MDSRRAATPGPGEAGFTLIETLVAIMLFGLVMGALATVTAEWLPNWKRGLLRAQDDQKVAIALERLVSDLSAAQSIAPNRLSKTPLFLGEETSVVFVRSALGPNGSRGLEIVQIAEISDSRGQALVRRRTPFTILPSSDPSSEQIKLADPVVLLREPFHVTFSYAGPDGQWMRAWHNVGILPSAVRFSIRNGKSGSALISTATRIHVDMMAPQPDATSEPEIEPAKPASGASAELR